MVEHVSGVDDVKCEIKKEVEKNLHGAISRDWEAVVTHYAHAQKGTEKGVILECYYFNRFGYWKTIRELNRQGFYMSQTVFYERLNEIITDIALRACYERLICP